MLAKNSDEGKLEGLGWIRGKVRHFSKKINDPSFSVPHMGWNDAKPSGRSKLFSKGFDKNAQFYFLHSYFFEAENELDVAATTDYGFEFHSAISSNNIHGVQFHPEKSHDWGKQLLKNFAELKEC